MAMNPMRFRLNLTSNLSLALASFFIAFAIWTIAKEDEMTEQKIDVAVRFQPPAYATLRVEPRTVQVTVRYPVSQANLLNPASVRVDLGGAIGEPRLWAGVNEEKTRTVEIDPRNAVHNLPQNFQVVQVQPGSVLLHGVLNAREAYIEPRIIGSPAAGYVAGKPQIDPATVMLIGAEADLDQLARNNNDEVVVPTEEINITGRNEYYETRAEILLPERVQLAEQQIPRATVIIPINEETGPKEITGIPVTVQTYSKQLAAQVTPAQASVRVEGPLSLVQGITAQDLVILPRETVEETLNAVSTVKLDCQFAETVPQKIREKVNIVQESLNPRTVQIKMVRPSKSTAIPKPTPPASIPARPSATPAPLSASASSPTSGTLTR